MRSRWSVCSVESLPFLSACLLNPPFVLSVQPFHHGVSAHGFLLTFLALDLLGFSHPEVGGFHQFWKVLSPSLFLHGLCPIPSLFLIGLLPHLSLNLFACFPILVSWWVISSELCSGWVASSDFFLLANSLIQEVLALITTLYSSRHSIWFLFDLFGFSF